MQKFKVEVIFDLEVKAENVDKAALIVDDIRIKHPQTSETLASVWVGAWEIETLKAGISRLEAALGLAQSHKPVVTFTDSGTEAANDGT